jgi:putative Mn2+ efflux pump MntP
MKELLTLVLIALSIGLDNFASSIAIGLSGIKKQDKIKIAVTFGAFETLMPVIGLFLGKRAAEFLGDKAHIIGAVMLVLTGLYIVIEGLKKTNDREAVVATKGVGKLLLAGLAISIDNLIVGFSIGTKHVSIPLAIVVIAIISVSLAIAGMEIGKRISTKTEKSSEYLSGFILVAIGLLIGFGIL